MLCLRAIVEETHSILRVFDTYHFSIENYSATSFTFKKQSFKLMKVFQVVSPLLPIHITMDGFQIRDSTIRCFWFTEFNLITTSVVLNNGRFNKPL